MLLRKRGARHPRSPRPSSPADAIGSSSSRRLREDPREQWRRPSSDELLALTAELNRSLLGHLAHDRKNFFLCAFDLGQTHRPARLEIVFQPFRCTLRHVLEDLLLEPVVRT